MPSDSRVSLVASGELFGGRILIGAVVDVAVVLAVLRDLLLIGGLGEGIVDRIRICSPLRVQHLLGEGSVRLEFEDYLRADPEEVVLRVAGILLARLSREALPVIVTRIGSDDLLVLLRVELVVDHDNDLVISYCRIG